MWTCPACQRQFKTANQSHSCVSTTIDDLFVDRPDHLVLAFDTLMTLVLHWEPVSFGASANTIVFTNSKAFLIVRPMTKVLDIKFYYDEPLSSEKLHKVSAFYGKYAHHIRIADEAEITDEVIELIRKGFEFGLK